MKFEIPFDEKIYRDQIDLTFKLTWENYVSETKKVLIAAIIFIPIALIILYANGKDVGIIFFILGVSGLIISIRRFIRHQNAKKETYRLTDQCVEMWLKSPTSTWEFTEEHFRFVCFTGEYKIYWEYFKYFNVVDSTLFFGHEKDSNYYTLSETEIGKEDFALVVKHLESKIKTSL